MKCRRSRSGIVTSALMALSACRKVANNLPCEYFIYFLVTWNGLSRPSFRVVVNVVLPSMPEQLGPVSLDSLDEIPALHPTSISSIFLIPGRS
jgi:hypothetical protein